MLARSHHLPSAPRCRPLCALGCCSAAWCLAVSTQRVTYEHSRSPLLITHSALGATKPKATKLLVLQATTPSIPLLGRSSP
jgi:hypothetical protein